MKKKNHYLRAYYFASMLTVNPFIEKSDTGIRFSGNRYTYVLNNPLKYIDPSGYVYRYSRIEENNAWHEGAQFYSAMMNLTARFSGGGGGGGRGSIGGGGLNGYTYNYFDGKYYNNGYEVSFDEVKENAIKPNAEWLIYQDFTSFEHEGTTYEHASGRFHVISSAGGMISDGSFSTFASKKDAQDYISKTNYWIGLTAAVLSGEMGLRGAVENIKKIQRISNQIGNNLDYSKEISRGRNLIKGAKLGGIITTGISMAFSLDSYNNGEITQGKLMADIGMAITANIPYVGWIAGLAYTIIDITYPGGITGFADDYSNQQMDFVNSVGVTTTTLMR